MSDNRKIKVLFVCLGNICRSPLGEGIFRHLVNQEGLSQYFHIDSAGTSGYNTGDKPDSAAIKVAKLHGVFIDDLRARKLEKSDLKDWDYIIAMDGSNLRNIKKLGTVSNRLHMMREFDPEGCGDVPDPWNCRDEAFLEAYNMIERSCRGLLESIIKEFSLESKEA